MPCWCPGCRLFVARSSTQPNCDVTPAGFLHLGGPKHCACCKAATTLNDDDVLKARGGGDHVLFGMLGSARMIIHPTRCSDPSCARPLNPPDFRRYGIFPAGEGSFFSFRVRGACAPTPFDFLSHLACVVTDDDHARALAGARTRLEVHAWA